MAPRSSPTGPSSTGSATSARGESGRGGGRIASVGERPTSTGGVDDVVDLAGGLLSPGFVDAHVHPIQGGLERMRCDLSERATREEYLAEIRAYADTPPRPRVDPRRRLGDAGVPGRHPDRGRPRRRRARPAGVPAQPRPPRRLGQQPGPRDRRHRREHARPARRPDRARRRRPPERHPARGRDGPGVAVPSADHRRGLLRRADGGPALPALRRRHVLAGRHRRRVLRHGRPGRDVRRRRPPTATSARTSSARCGGSAARRRAGRRPGRATRGTHRRPVPAPRA